MRTYSASGDRTVVGYITGDKGQYEVFHSSPRSNDLYFRNSATNKSTRFRFNPNSGHYVGPDGSAYYNNQSVIAAIQNQYNLGKLGY